VRAALVSLTVDIAGRQYVLTGILYGIARCMLLWGAEVQVRAVKRGAKRVKFDAIKKRGEQWVRIRPALQIYSDSAVLVQPAVEDAWYLSNVSEDGVTLRSRDTQHSRRLGLDHVHHYMEDPEPNAIQTTGIVVLNVQLLIFENQLIVEPSPAPGQPLRTFAPARTRATLFSVATKAAAERALDRRRKEYAWNEGVREAQQAFDDFAPMLRSLESALSANSTPVPLQIRPSGKHSFLLGACGWFETWDWQQQAANHIEGAFLTIRKFDGPPRLPGTVTLREPRQLTVRQYRWDLVALDSARWVPNGRDDVSYTSEDLVTRELTELIERPLMRQ